MKLYLLICIILFHSCSYKPQDKHLVSSEYVVDSTLERNYKGKHSDKYIFYTLRFDCSFAAANTIKPQLL